MKIRHFWTVLLLLFSLAPSSSADERADAQFASCCANIKNIAIASEMYSTDFGGKYPASLKTLTPTYIRKIPTCPASNKQTYSYRTDPKNLYVIICQGLHHQGAGFSKNQPAYNGRVGLYPKAVSTKYQQALDKYMASRPELSCASNLKNLGTALEMWSSDNQGRYPRKLSQVAPNYFRRIPKCPAAKRDTYSSSYISGQNPDSYSVHCSGTHHKSEGVPANYPSYDSQNGLKRR